MILLVLYLYFLYWKQQIKCDKRLVYYIYTPCKYILHKYIYESSQHAYYSTGIVVFQMYKHIHIFKWYILFYSVSLSTKSIKLHGSSFWRLVTDSWWFPTDNRKGNRWGKGGTTYVSSSWGTARRRGTARCRCRGTARRWRRRGAAGRRRPSSGASGAGHSATWCGQSSWTWPETEI